MSADFCSGFLCLTFTAVKTSFRWLINQLPVSWSIYWLVGLLTVKKILELSYAPPPNNDHLIHWGTNCCCSGLFALCVAALYERMRADQRKFGKSAWTAAVERMERLQYAVSKETLQLMRAKEICLEQRKHGLKEEVKCSLSPMPTSVCSVKACETWGVVRSHSEVDGQGEIKRGGSCVLEKWPQGPNMLQWSE